MGKKTRKLSPARVERIRRLCERDDAKTWEADGRILVLDGKRGRLVPRSQARGNANG